MKFLGDAQLPRRLAYRLREAGHDVVHTLDLPGANATSDEETALPTIVTALASCHFVELNRSALVVHE